MATLLLLDTASWGKHAEVAAASSFLSSIYRANHSLPSCKPSPPNCSCHSKSPQSPTTRCVSLDNFIDRLDLEELPRHPNQSSNKEIIASRPHVVLDTIPIDGSQPYNDVITMIKRIPTHESLDTLEKPSSPSHKDTSKATLFAEGQDLDLRRSQRVAPSYLSVSQSSRTSQRVMRNGSTIQLATIPLQMKDIKETPSVFMAFIAIILGLATVLQKGGLLGIANAPTKICSRCNGYGIELCDLCKGRGGITWEGKLRHIDPCPLCFGSRTKKCSDCGGVRVQKGVPPFLQQKARLNSSKKRP